MISKSKNFNANTVKLDAGKFIHFINIENIDSNLETLIDKRIVSICEGKTNSDLNLIKRRLIDFLTPKRNTTIEMGAIAEFFLHLYLYDIGYKQEFLYLNLEEGSIKKGFDGYFSFKNEEWVLESKSGDISTINISHTNKAKEAYFDLEEKIKGKTKNNPWQNAYNHARTVGTKDNIQKNIKKLSDEFTYKKFHKIDDFNIIPCSTIFLNARWKVIDELKIETDIKKIISTFKCKKLNIICINKKSIKLFWRYLKK